LGGAHGNYALRLVLVGSTVFPMMKAFISYAHADRKIAGQIKAEMAEFQIDCFLAHEDLEPSVEWQKEIKAEFKDCTLFFALVSSHFRVSKWADQEVGMAVAWNKIIVPFSLEGVAPYGFIGKYQSRKVAFPLLCTVAKPCFLLYRGSTRNSGTVNASIPRPAFSRNDVRAHAYSWIISVRDDIRHCNHATKFTPESTDGPETGMSDSWATATG
jgi:hypothetical protein